MARLTRRLFLHRTSVGAAAVGMLPVAAGLLKIEQAPEVTEVEKSAPALSESLVAYIHTASQGQVTLFIGAREIVVQDAELIARLVKAVS